MTISNEVFIEQINKAYQVVQQVQVIIATINKMIIDEGANEEEISTLQSLVLKVQSDIASINNRMNNINSSLSTQSGQISNINSDISTLNSSINTLRSDLGALTNVVNSLQTSKQDTLVSGSNIKKITVSQNGAVFTQDLLGSGSINIESGATYTHHIKINDGGDQIFGDIYLDFVSTNSQEFTMDTFLQTLFEAKLPDLSVLNFYGLWNGDSTILKFEVVSVDLNNLYANITVCNINTLEVTSYDNRLIAKGDELEDTVIHF